MKKISLIIIALVCISATSFAQTYKTNLSANPSITDLFLTAAKYDNCETEVVKYAAEAVKINKGRYITKRVVDKANGYIMVQMGNNEESRFVESCYWKMNNGKLLLAIGHLECQEMETTLHFYEFDKSTRTLKVVEKPFSLDLGNKAAEVTYELPRYGKTIKAQTYSLLTKNNEPYRWDITWNGSRFVVKHIY